LFDCHSDYNKKDDESDVNIIIIMKLMIIATIIVPDSNPNHHYTASGDLISSGTLPESENVPPNIIMVKVKTLKPDFFWSRRS
jgi:hypothetical protein